MNEPAIQQDAEGVRTGAVWGVALAVVAISALLVAIAWWLVVPPPSGGQASSESWLKRDPIERATGGAEIRAAGEQRLERSQWIDRRAGLVRIPIERAINAVVANPALIGARAAAVGTPRARTGPREVAR